MNIAMMEDGSTKNQQSGMENGEKKSTLSVQDIKNTLSMFKKDRSWLATSLNRSISTVNGWLSAGKPIPSKCINEIQILFNEEKIRQNKTAKSITASSDEEWESWEKEAEKYSWLFDNIQEWARSVLNQEVTKSQESLSVNKEKNKTYDNPIIFPIDSSSAELWGVVYDFSKINSLGEGKYTFLDPPKSITIILNIAAKKKIENTIKDNKTFSLKSAERALDDYLTEADFENERKRFIFSPGDTLMWSIAAALDGTKSVNEWANKIIDANVEKKLLERIGITDEDDEISFYR